MRGCTIEGCTTIHDSGGSECPTHQTEARRRRIAARRGDAVPIGYDNQGVALYAWQVSDAG